MMRFGIEYTAEDDFYRVTQRKLFCSIRASYMPDGFANPAVEIFKTELKATFKQLGKLPKRTCIINPLSFSEVDGDS